MMRYIADLHIHSKYAGACSDALTIENINATAIKKGIGIIGTGDFTHPEWLKEIKSKLSGEEGIFRINGADSTNFVLSSEVSVIYNDGRGFKKIHNCILAPNIEVVESINDSLSKFANLRGDGRPMLNVKLSEFVEILHQIDKNIFVFPAHCILPGEPVLMNPEIKEIQNVSVGEKIFTHKGEARKVEKVMSRQYSGKVFRITPWYLGNGIRVTSEHPFLAIKTVKNCNGGGGPCKPISAHIRNCYKHFYKNYKPEWIQAEQLEIGDVLLYPRFIKEEEKQTINVEECLLKSRYSQIKIDSNLCRLVGYYLAEGYTNGRDGIGFSFHKDSEKDYVEDVRLLLQKIFGLSAKRGKTDGDLILYSREIMTLFQELFYTGSIKRAQYKCMPQWMLFISRQKQVELLKGWWRGDKGSTSSRLLFNQMKIICLRLGILPSVHVDTIEAYEKRGRHIIGKRQIKANSNNYVFSRLTFFEDSFGLLKEKEFARCISKTDIRHGWLDEEFAYLPIRKIEIKEYSGMVYNLEVEEDHSFLTESACVHNCWTPWYGVFGSFSGFDSIKDAYEDQAMHIHALETGLSSDPKMNWRVSELDKYTLLSGSDAHSLPKIGREAVVLEMDKDRISYNELVDRIINKKLDYTVEFYPEEGKYHYDGHRNCRVSLSPDEAKRYNNICPVCRRRLTVGVLHRVEELADREPGYTPRNAVPYVHMVPLQEVIAYVSGKATTSEYVRRAYSELIDAFGSEFNLLLDVDIERIASIDRELANAIGNVRGERVSIEPGYDGVFGVIDLLNRRGPMKRRGVQYTIADF